MPQRDHYEVLGVRRDASPEEIKSAFKKLAAQWHPGPQPGGSEAHDRFKEINLAYQVLSDPNRRTIYDRIGHRAEEPGSPFGANGPFPGGFVDIATSRSTGFWATYWGLRRRAGGKGTSSRSSSSLRGSCVRLREAVRYERIVVLYRCRGSGPRLGPSQTCGACNGRGRVRFQQGIFPIAVERTCSHCRGRAARSAMPAPPAGGAGS